MTPALPDFRDLYDAELPWLLRTIRRLGGRPADLEDLAHDVLCIVHRRLGDFDPTRPLRPWLYGIAARVVLDYHRKASTHRETTGPAPESVDTSADPSESLAQRRQRALVLAALDTLPDAQRVVFVAHELDGTPIAALVEVLEVPLNTLYSRLRLARQHFAAAVRRLLAEGAAA